MVRLVVLLGFALASPASAHSRLTSPVPRNDYDDIKDTNALHPPPCGGPRGTITLSKLPGDQILVEWDETIDHLGHYEILFSMANDQNFAFLTDPAGTTLNNIADVEGGTLPHHYTQMVKLPSTPCPACTLQVKQFMEGAGYYMTCADVELRDATVDAGPVIAADAGASADMAEAPQAQPQASSPPAPSDPAPSDKPTPMDTPDLATPLPPSAIPPTKFDYNYGCSAAPGATAAFPLILFFSVLGTARIGWRSRRR